MNQRIEVEICMRTVSAEDSDIGPRKSDELLEHTPCKSKRAGILLSDREPLRDAAVAREMSILCKEPFASCGGDKGLL